VEARCLKAGLHRCSFICEKGFKRVKGFASIPDVLAIIEAEQEEQIALNKAA